MKVAISFQHGPYQEVTYSDYTEFLFLLFNKIQCGNFSDEWNSASILPFL